MRNDFGVCMKAGGLVGGQKKLDVRDGKITGADFKLLRKKKKKAKK